MTGIYKKGGMMVTRKIADELVMVPIRHNVGDLAHIYTLNNVASRIWELLDSNSTVDDIVTTLIKEYDVDPQQAVSDVVGFLDQMRYIGAVTYKNQGG
jgi:hypothetical protein